MTRKTCGRRESPPEADAIIDQYKKVDRVRILRFQETAALVFFCKVLPLSRGVAQPGRAPGSGPGGRRFKSSLPDQSFQVLK